MWLTVSRFPVESAPTWGFLVLAGFGNGERDIILGFGDRVVDNYVTIREMLYSQLKLH